MQRFVIVAIAALALTTAGVAEAQERRARSAGPGGGPAPLTGEELEAAKAIVADLLASPPPSAEQMRGFLGTWEGTMLHEGGVPEKLIVTFEVQGDKLVGETKSTLPDGRRETYPAAFIRLVEDDTTLEWGVENERLGGAIGVYSVSLVEGDELRGVLELRGIPFALPPGLELPEMVVALRRSRRSM